MLKPKLIDIPGILIHTVRQQKSISVPHTHSQTATSTLEADAEFSILPKDTSACGPGEARDQITDTLEAQGME